MEQYVVMHRQEKGVYSVWSSYAKLDRIESELYEAFLNAPLGDEFVVIDTHVKGNGVVCVYKTERRIIRREIGSLEKAWSKDRKPKAYPIDIGDGAKIIRFV